MLLNATALDAYIHVHPLLGCVSSFKRQNSVQLWPDAARLNHQTLFPLLHDPRISFEFNVPEGRLTLPFLNYVYHIDGKICLPISEANGLQIFGASFLKDYSLQFNLDSNQLSLQPAYIGCNDNKAGLWSPWPENAAVSLVQPTDEANSRGGLGYGLGFGVGLGGLFVFGATIALSVSRSARRA